VGAVLSITSLFTHNAHAQSNWWEQAKRNRPPPPPTSVEQTSPPPPVQPLALPPVSASQEQDIDTDNIQFQKNTAISENKDADLSLPSTHYFEGGRAGITLTDYDESASGGYFRVSLGTPYIHFLGSYQKPAKDFSITELGIGSISKHRLQLTTALTRQFWEVGTVERSFNKAIVGLRTQFSPHFDMWIGMGYMWTNEYTEVYNYQGQLIATNFVDTSVGNLGIQFLITPDTGIVLELDTLEDLGIDFFRAGIRVSF